METDFNYQYTYPSSFSLNTDRKSFSFSHCSEIEEDCNVPAFFYGRIKNAFEVSKCLSTLARTVGSHFALTPGQLIYLKDPIVSVGNQELRFEAFSSCNSVYARLDILSGGIEGDFLHAGCTNIDFNDQTIKAFNAVSQSDQLFLGVGSREVQIITDKHSSTEKKVSLPNRWIKGLGNVQVYLSQSELVFKLSRIETIQLFKTLPTTPAKGDYYLSKNSFGYSFSPSYKPNSLMIGGVHRLGLLRNLILSIDSLFVYKAADEQSVAIVLEFNNAHMTFLFSKSVFRGFSGEGKNLENLINNLPIEWIKGLNNLFKTNECFNPILLSIENNIGLKTMEELQSSLSSIGLLGYNLIDNSYFYRKLPFKLERLTSFNPRLENAEKIIRNNEAVIIEKTSDYLKAEVKGTAGVIHTVIRRKDDYQCTCNWYTNNKNTRGFCKHILAVKIKTA
jgi:hypothetical protein